MPRTIMPLLRYRLRWYAVSTARMLLRRWQGFLLMSGVLASAGASAAGNIALLAHPLLAVLGPGHGPLWRSAYLGALACFAALWAAVQRAQIEGGAFMAFAGSLPFSRRQRRQVDLSVLLLADSPLLLLVAAALALTAARHAPAAHLVLLGDVALLALLAQFAVLERRPMAAAPVAGACVLLGTSFDAAPGLALALLVGAAAAVLLGRPPAAPRRMGRPPAQARAPALARLGGRHAPAFQIALAVLYREGRNEAVAKAVAAAGIAAAAIALAEIFDRDTRSFPTILLAQGAIALTCSGMFRGLAMAHRGSAGYVGALPLPGRWSVAADLAAVLTLGLPCLAALAAYGLFAGAAPPGRLLGAVLSYSLLLCALRAPQLFNERHAVVLATALAGCWVATTVACLA
jgi:hypothetical protein